MNDFSRPHHSLLLSGRHALVTGAGGGIGQAICQTLARHGANVTLLGRKRAELEGVCAQLAGSGHGVAVADVTDPAAVASAIGDAARARGTIGVLVCNAGAASSAPLIRTQPAAWQSMLDVNLSGTYHCILAALPSMIEAGWGRIVNVASTAGLRGYAYVAAYCAAKHGVIGLTRALALEVAKTGVTVNAVCPGYTDTPLLDGAIGNIVAKTGRSAEQAKTTLAASNPQGRLVLPDEVANAVAWLCLPGSESVHGQSIAVAGGEVM
ncbi:MAG: SDR family oxidoreductase [Burkholderiaceae bacterium]|jgi:NAD(P)-dependent dehydrogenase (short-subunit alcohol dehydrogenase family)|nr:SDR family oxidoreductase [Burkholderiaceae bacterium]